jgi:imidazolonepropionase-like amidohydrolase
MKTLFVNGLLIDGLGGHQERSALLVDGDRIGAVGPEVAVQHREADRVIDLAGRALMPGMIDCHAHPGAGDERKETEHDSYGLAAIRTIQAAQRTLWAGITTVRNAGTRDFVDVDARDAINAGLFVGPRLLCAGRAITMTGGHGHKFAVEVDGPEQIRAEVRRQVKRGVDAIKILASGGIGTPAQSPHHQMFTAEEIAAAVDEANRYTIPTLTHAMGNQAVRNCIAAGVTSIDHGNFLDEEICQMMIDRGIYYVPTFGCYYYYAVRRLADPEKCARTDPVIEPHRQSFQLAMRMGVKIALGCDCGAPSQMPNGENALEFWLYVQNGMPAEQAIVCGTSSSAKLLRIDHLVGSLEPGKMADLVVIDGNPLDDIATLLQNVALVMKDGTIVRNELDGGKTDLTGEQAWLAEPLVPTPVG